MDDTPQKNSKIYLFAGAAIAPLFMYVIVTCPLPPGTHDDPLLFKLVITRLGFWMFIDIGDAFPIIVLELVQVAAPQVMGGVSLFV